MRCHKYIGVDGCKAGWFYVGISRYGECDIGVFETLPKLWQANKKQALILIDIPIGLPSREKPTRQCDWMARKLLSPLRHNSVFSPPCREVLLAASYQDACQINESMIGKKISIMAWGITAKIREADNLLKDRPKTRSVIRECHPEVCFYGLNGGRSMEHYKKKPMGQEERLELLNAHYDKSKSIFKAALDRFKRKDVARDDIIDALAAAVTGFLSRGNLTTLPENLEMDEWGRPMEMVYFSVAPKSPEKAAQPGTGASGVISEMFGRHGCQAYTVDKYETWAKSAVDF